MKKFCFVLMVLMLQGCFSSTPNSSFYLLESEQRPLPVSNKNISVSVADIFLPDYLQKPQIVLQKSDSPELKISEFNRWGSDLEGMIQNIIIEDLQNLMPNAVVKPLTFGTKTQYVVKINIEKMSGYFNQKAVLKGVYQILSTSGKVIKQKDFKFERMVGKTYADYAKVQSILLSDLANKLAGDVIKY